MPDPERKTLSSTQVAVAMNLSPYGTAWLLWHHFANELPIDEPENPRMKVGKLMQPVILALAAEELHLETTETEIYERALDVPVGCTRDAHVICPERGFGVIEAKNVDWRVWRESWTEVAAPRHIELQVQVQLMVPHPEHGLPTWGVIAAFIGGNELRLYERRPMPKVQALIAETARDFFASIKEGHEPNVVGSPREIPALGFLYPEVVPAKERDMRGDPDLAELVMQYDWACGEHTFTGKLAEQLRVKILAAAEDAGSLRTHGARTKITKSPVKAAVVKRKAYVRQTVKVMKLDDGPMPEAELSKNEISTAAG